MNVLEQAAELLENGWCQGSLHEHMNDGDVFCAVGALATVITGQVQRTDMAYEIIENHASGMALFLEIMDERIRTASSEYTQDLIEYRDAARVDRARFDISDEIINFNDAADNKEEVIEVMKHAAKRLDC